MKLSGAFAIAASLVHVGEAADANPLGKVIELMDSLTATIVKEGEDGAKAYKDFFEWCDDAARNLKQEIETGTTKKEKLTAAIGKHTGNIEASTAKIAELASSISSDDSDLKAATAIREKEAADYAANEAEITDVIGTLSRALTILEKEMSKNPAAFAQVDTSSLDNMLTSLGAVVDAVAFSTADRQKLVALVQSQQSSDDDDDEPGAPAAASYKSHSAGILDVVADMKEKAEGQLSDLRKAEGSTKHNFEMLKQSLEDQIDADTKAKDGETTAQAASSEAKATAEGDLAGTVKDLANAVKGLDVARSDCMQTASDHQATVAAREEELKTIAQAKKILGGSTADAEKQTYSFMQMRTHADLAGSEVVSAVKTLAKLHHSAALAQLASQVAAILHYGTSAGEDPFGKVRGLISEMISKLENEAQSEASEKSYCDEQMAKTEAKKGELEEDLSKLDSKIESAAARSAGLKEDVRELQAELAALAKTQAEMDKIRTESHAAYVEAKDGLTKGLDGVRKALTVLRDYYGSDASAALLQSGDDLDAQMQQPAQPAAFEKSSGAGSSIMGILEVVESDFANNLAKEETEESDAAAEYEKTTQENKVTTTLKTKDVEYKTQSFTGLDKNIAELKADRDSTDSELGAVNEYYAKIKDRCIAKPETYEARQGRRQAEIKGLKSALAILNDETALVQRRKKGGLRGRHLSM